MIALRGFTISIGYADALRVTLPLNARHFKECLVITSPDDEATQGVARSVPGVELFITDAATLHGAYFNKGLCFERAWDYWGRHGWFLIWDADIVMPEAIPLDWVKSGTLYGARRRILEDPRSYHPRLDWNRCPRHLDGGPIGFFQLFDSMSPDIRDKRPWYDVSFPHAGGGDAYFMYQFKINRRSVLGIDCLHLGPPDVNWYGVDQRGRDIMSRFVHENNWLRAMRRHSRLSAERAGEFVKRIEVPGYAPSGYELPFVRPAKGRRGP